MGGPGLQKIFFRHSGPWSKDRDGGGGAANPQGPSPGSATASPQINFLDILTFFPPYTALRRAGLKRKIK